MVWLVWFSAFAGARGAAAAAGSVADLRSPLVGAGSAAPPDFRVGAGAQLVCVEVRITGRVKLGEELWAVGSQRALAGDRARPPLALAAMSAFWAAVAGGARSDPRRPLMAARAASPPHFLA